MTNLQHFLCVTNGNIRPLLAQRQLMSCSPLQRALPRENYVFLLRLVATVEILNALGGRVPVTISNVAVPALGSSDPLATADYHVGAASDALCRLDSTAFVAAVLSAASTARATSGATTAASTAQYTHTVSSVHYYVGSDETLWLLTALENYERSVRATGDDTFIIAQRNVSSLTAVQLLAVAQGFALTDSSLTPGSDVSAGPKLLAALNATEAAAVFSSHALAAFITEEIMANLAEQQVPITGTLDAAVTVASIIATYGDVKTNAVLSATSTAVSLADLMDRTLARCGSVIALYFNFDFRLVCVCLGYATLPRPHPQTSPAARVMLRRRGTQRRVPRTFCSSATCTLSL